MNVSGIASLATELADTGLKQQVGISVLRKALDIEGATAASLIAAIPQAGAANLPSHLGQNINTVA